MNPLTFVKAHGAKGLTFLALVACYTAYLMPGRSSRPLVNPLEHSIAELQTLERHVANQKMLITNWVFLQGQSESNIEDKQDLKAIVTFSYSASKERLLELKEFWPDPEDTVKLVALVNGLDSLFEADREVMTQLNSFDDYEDPVKRIDARNHLFREIYPATEAIGNDISLLAESLLKRALAAYRWQQIKNVAAWVAPLALATLLLLGWWRGGARPNLAFPWLARILAILFIGLTGVIGHSLYTMHWLSADVHTLPKRKAYFELNRQLNELELFLIRHKMGAIQWVFLPWESSESQQARSEWLALLAEWEALNTNLSEAITAANWLDDSYRKQVDTLLTAVHGSASVFAEQELMQALDDVGPRSFKNRGRDAVLYAANGLLGYGAQVRKYFASAEYRADPIRKFQAEEFIESAILPKSKQPPHQIKQLRRGIYNIEKRHAWVSGEQYPLLPLLGSIFITTVALVVGLWGNSLVNQRRLKGF